MRTNSSRYNLFKIFSAVCFTGEFSAEKSDEDAPRESGRKGTLKSEGTFTMDPRKESDSRDADPTAGDSDGRGPRLVVLGASASDISKLSSVPSPLSRKISTSRHHCPVEMVIQMRAVRLTVTVNEHRPPVA
eukprot:2744507-Pleurochrysis_carterae.AAC.1